jgi:type II secretory pathway pseudopilin PulG
MLAMMIALGVLAVIVLVVIASAMGAYSEASRQRQINQRVQVAQREIEAIGRETQAAIRAEAARWPKRTP